MTREHKGERSRRTEFRLEFVVRIRLADQPCRWRRGLDEHRGDGARAARWRREDVAQPLERLEAAQAKRVSLEDVAQDCPALAQAIDEDRRVCAAACGFPGSVCAGLRQRREKSLVAFDRKTRCL